MRHLQENGLRFSLLLVLVMTAVTADAAISYQSSVPSFSKTNDQLLARSITDYDWRAAEQQAAIERSGNPIRSAQLPGYALETIAADQAPEGNDVIRHRGFGKALLIILICGGLVRLLTSPAYLKFISDVLDPKAF